MALYELINEILGDSEEVIPTEEVKKISKKIDDTMMNELRSVTFYSEFEKYVTKNKDDENLKGLVFVIAHRVGPYTQSLEYSKMSSQKIEFFATYKIVKELYNILEEYNHDAEKALRNV